MFWIVAGPRRKNQVNASTDKALFRIEPEGRLVPHPFFRSLLPTDILLHLALACMSALGAATAVFAAVGDFRMAAVLFIRRAFDFLTTDAGSTTFKLTSQSK